MVKIKIAAIFIFKTEDLRYGYESLFNSFQQKDN